ncbi:MAG: phosphoenolpyruvate carboxykinase domain-containing protein [Thermoplasmata archaeon]
MGAYDEVLSTVSSTVKGLEGRPNVSSPQPAEIQQRAQRFGTKTEFGNYNFASVVKNRSAGLTVYVGSDSVLQDRLNPRQKEILEAVPETVHLVDSYVKRPPVVRSVRRMGQNPDFSPLCTLYLSTHRPEVIRLAHFFNLALFDPVSEDQEPPFFLIDLPEWQEKDRQILVFPEIGSTYVLGSDYYGEVKKGFLRMAMWQAKQRGMLGVHAGSKLLRARGADGRVRKYSMLAFGLTATGKTTHTCHTHDLQEDGEGIEIAQDDVVIVREDWSALGTERGFFLKTEGLNAETQPLIYRAITQKDAVFENVLVDHGGSVDFDDLTLTGNGRGIMQRTAFGEYMGPVNIPAAKELDGSILAFITRRNTIMPIAAKLTTDQVAAAFMLGESVESSGGDPRRAGMSVREVGTNPFIIGDKAEEGNRFYDFLKANEGKVQGYLLNTGGVGEVAEVLGGRRVVKRKVLRVEIPEMASIIRGIARDTTGWMRDRYWDLLVPEEVEGVDLSKFDLSNFYPEEKIRAMVEALRRERLEYLKSFEGLQPEIVEAGGF